MLCTWPSALIAALMLMIAQVADGGPVPSAPVAGFGVAALCLSDGQGPVDAPPTHDHDCGFCPAGSAAPHWSMLPVAGAGWPMPRVGVAAMEYGARGDVVVAERRHAQPRGPPAPV